MYYTLGFALYSLIYAAAGSLVSRPEDLQIIALPLSLLAIVGYIQAILALTGGITGFIRFASLVPFWSPFVMLTRLSVGRVEPMEIVVSIGLLVVTIVVDGGRRDPDLLGGRAALRPAARGSGRTSRPLVQPGVRRVRRRLPAGSDARDGRRTRYSSNSSGSRLIRASTGAAAVGGVVLEGERRLGGSRPGRDRPARPG